MRDYDINVKGLCTYTIKEAKSEEEAIIQAIDDFCNDDMFYGDKVTENVTKDDCVIDWCSNEY